MKIHPIVLKRDDLLYSVDGYIGFFCKKCYKVHIFMISNIRRYDSRYNYMGLDIESRYAFTCKECGYYNRYDEYLDPNIVESISILNKKNYITYCSCEGHYGDYDSYVLFKTYYSTIEKYSNLPKYWYKDRDCYYIDKNFDKVKATCIRCDTRYALNTRMNSLLRWAKHLPSNN